MSFDEDKLRLMWEKTILEGSLTNKDPGLTYGRRDPAPEADLNPALFPTLLVNPIEASTPAEGPAPEIAATMPMNQANTIVSPPPSEEPAPEFAPTIPMGQADTIVAPPPQSQGRGDENAPIKNFQNYELKKEIGRGGMGVVYAAKQGGLDRLVAVKKNLDNQLEARSRFISEAIVTGQLDHPNIVPVYDMGFSSEGEILLSMKLVGGQAWSDWLKDNFNDEKRLPEDKLLEAFEILIKVCDAISFSHEKQIVHNDLKPENVMVGKHGEVFVMDWGLAVDVSHRDGEALTQSQRQTLHKSTLRSPCGTPAYMAPELANGDGNQICPQTDVYLLGAILYELVTGRRRHRGKTLLMVLRSAVLSEEPDFEDHKEVEEEIQKICRKAMKLNPEDRYSSAKEFQIAIKNHLQHRESLKIAHVASETLGECEKARLELIREETKTLNESQRNRLYGQYADVVAGFKQALILWGDNKEAKRGILNASVAYAKTALSQNDLGLAEAQLASLPPGLNATLELSREINAAKQVLINKEKQQKRVRWALAGTVLTILIGLAVGLIIINKEKSRATENAETAQRSAEEAKANAREAKRQAKIARQQSEEALRQKQRATTQKIEAEKQKVEADQQRKIAQQEREIATKLQALAVEAAKRAEIEAARALTLRSEADYQTALARYELALGTVREGDGFVLAGRWRQARDSYSKARIMFEEISQPVLPADLGLWSCNRVQSPVILESLDCRNSITAMTSHPTENWVFTGHGTGTIKVWDLHSGKILHSWIGHEREVRSLAVSPDGRYLLSGSGAAKRNVFLWALFAKNPYSISIVGHKGPVNSVAFSKKGTHFFTAGDDAKLRYWSLRSRELVSTTDIPNSGFGKTFDRAGVLSIDVSPGNEFLTVGSASGQAFILNLKTRKRREITHRLSVNSVQFSPNGEFVVSASSDGRIKLTDTKSGVVRNTLVGHRSLVMSAVISQDGRKILSCSEDHTARVWDVKTGETIRILGPLPQAIHSVAFSGDGRFAIAAGYRTGVIKIWSLDEDPGVIQFQAFPELNSALATSKDGLYVASATRDRSFVLWDSQTGFPLKTFSSRAQVQSLQFTPNSLQVLAGYNRMIKVWDIQSGTCVRTLKLDHGGYIYSLALSQNGRRCLSGNADGSVTVWDLEKGTALHSFRIEKSRFKRRRITISPKGKVYVVTVGPTLHLFDSQTFKLIKTLKTDDLDCLTVRFSPDGEQIYALASNSRKDFQIFIIEWKSGQVLNQSQCNGHDRRVNGFAFSPNREIVATTGHDLRLKLWQCRDGRELKSIQAHRSFIMNLAAMPGNAKFVTVTRSESLRVWDFQHSAQLELKKQARFKKETIESLRKNPDSGASLRIRGEWLAFRKIHNFAISDLEDAKEKGEPVSELTLARLYLATGQWDKSSACFKRLLESKKWTAPVHKNYLELCQEAVQKSAQALNSQVTPGGRVIRAVLRHPNKKHLIIAGNAVGEPPIITVLDIESRRVIRRLHGHKEPPRCLSVSNDGRWLLSGGGEASALLWHLETGRLAQKLSGHSRAVTFVALSKNARRAVTVSDDQKIRVWDLESNTVKKTVKPHQYYLRTSAQSPDFETLVTSDTRGQIKIINTKTGEVTKTIAGLTRGYKTMIFSPDGKMLAMSGRDGSLQIWSAETFEQLFQLDGQVGLANSLHFSDDSSFLLAVGYDKAARSWDLRSKKIVGEKKGFPTALTQGQFLQGGKKIVIGDHNGTLWFHELREPKEGEEK